MRRSLAVLVLAAGLAACGGGADALLETAAFEVVQNNPEHARQLYRQVIDEYPGTPQATTAAARLQELDGK